MGKGNGGCDGAEGAELVCSDRTRGRPGEAKQTDSAAEQVAGVCGWFGGGGQYQR